MKLGVVGSRSAAKRNWTWEAIRRFRQVHPGVDFIVSGGASGPDTFAIEYAKANALDWVEYLPDSSLYGSESMALLARNTKIAIACDVLLAIWDGQSKGTKDTIDKAKAIGKQVYVAKIGVISLEQI